MQHPESERRRQRPRTSNSSSDDAPPVPSSSHVLDASSKPFFTSNSDPPVPPPPLTSFAAASDAEDDGLDRDERDAIMSQAYVQGITADQVQSMSVGVDTRRGLRGGNGTPSLIVPMQENASVAAPVDDSCGVRGAATRCLDPNLTYIDRAGKTVYVYTSCLPLPQRDHGVPDFEDTLRRTMGVSTNAAVHKREVEMDLPTARTPANSDDPSMGLEISDRRASYAAYSMRTNASHSRFDSELDADRPVHMYDGHNLRAPNESRARRLERTQRSRVDAARDPGDAAVSAPPLSQGGTESLPYRASSSAPESCASRSNLARLEREGRTAVPTTKQAASTPSNARPEEAPPMLGPITPRALPNPSPMVVALTNVWHRRVEASGRGSIPRETASSADPASQRRTRSAPLISRVLSGALGTARKADPRLADAEDDARAMDGAGGGGAVGRGRVAGARAAGTVAAPPPMHDEAALRRPDLAASDATSAPSTQRPPVRAPPVLWTGDSNASARSSGVAADALTHATLARRPVRAPPQLWTSDSVASERVGRGGRNGDRTSGSAWEQAPERGAVRVSTTDAAKPPHDPLSGEIWGVPAPMLVRAEEDERRGGVALRTESVSATHAAQGGGARSQVQSAKDREQTHAVSSTDAVRADASATRAMSAAASDSLRRGYGGVERKAYDANVPNYGTIDTEQITDKAAAGARTPTSGAIVDARAGASASEGTRRGGGDASGVPVWPQAIGTATRDVRTGEGRSQRVGGKVSGAGTATTAQALALAGDVGEGGRGRRIVGQAAPMIPELACA